MRFLATLFRNLSRHGAVERDLDEEVQAHVELLVDEYRATGMEDAAARRAARLELGGTGQVKDAVRDVRRGIWLEHFWQDLRYALRTFRRSPGFAATAVVSLAVGIAAATGMLAVVGLYSVMSYSVSCRFKEFGIRMALGAGRGRIVNAAVQPAVLAIVAGLFAGLALSVGLNKVVAHWSIGNLNDPVVLVAVSLVLFVVTMMSAAIPANRAASIQPADALRTD